MAKKRSLSSTTNSPARQPSFEHLRLEETMGFLLSDATRTMTRIFSARIAAHGIGMGVFQFLRILWEEDGLTQSQLAARTRMREPSAAGALYSLEGRGLVRRTVDPNDRRKVRVLLTSEGRRLYDLVMPDIAVINGCMLVDFSAAEQAMLKAMLRRIRGNLTAVENSPAKADTLAHASGRRASARSGNGLPPSRR